MAILFDTDSKLGHVMLAEGWSTKITCTDGQELIVCHNSASECYPPIRENGKTYILSHAQVYIAGPYYSNWCAYRREKQNNGYTYREVGSWFLQAFILKHGGVAKEETIK